MPSNLQTRARRAGYSASSAHPADSSQIFLSLLNLVRRGGAKGSETTDEAQLIAPAALRTLLSALHYRDKPTVYHARRVALICTGIAGELGWEESDSRILEVAALLHDLGKLGVPDSILRKPGPLSADESEFISLNNRVGLTLMQGARIHPCVIDTIAQMTSVPGFKAADDHPGSSNTGLGARILAVADVYDSLTHDQVFRKHLEPAAAMQALFKSERKLDRHVIAALRRWLDGGGCELVVDDDEARAMIDASAPVDDATIREASSLCHACNYLYMLESLYDGYYVVDSELRVVISSLGLTRLLPGGGLAVGERWSRKAIGGVDQLGKPLGDAAYPMHRVLQSSRPECATINVPRGPGRRMALELHAIPMLDDEGNLRGVAEILRNDSQSKQNPVLYKELRQAASRDPLTGVANRGELEIRLRDLHADFLQHEAATPYSVIFIDIDHFKKINDTYEHAAGDKVLVNLVRLLEDELYSGETVGRYGGEEFLVVCPGTDLKHAVKRAERVRNAMQNANLGEDLPFTVTASFGVAEVAAADTAETVLQRADQALFDAKRSGRNRTCFREPDDMPPAVARTGGEPGEADHHSGGFVHTANILVCEAADMVVYKLKGFVEDNEARLLDVRSNLVGMQVGRKTMFGKWGHTGRKQPVDLLVSIGDEVLVGRSATKRVKMEVTVTPIGNPEDPEAFHRRAAQVLENLRSYLLAD